MRRTTLVALGTLLFVGALASANAQAPPLPAALGPDRGWIDSVAVSPDFDRDGRIWAATFGSKIFASADSASSWHPSRQGETDPVVVGLAVSPAFANDHTLFAAADDGVFRSQDSGASWSPATHGLNGRPCRAVVISPSYATDRSLWVATDQGVYRSVDGGDTWAAPLNGSVAVSALGAGGSGGGLTLFAGPAYGGLLRSSDGGLHWSAVAAFPTGRLALSIAAFAGAAGNTTVIIGTDTGVLVSTNAGLTFGPPALPTDRIAAVALSPGVATDGRVFAGSASGRGVYRSSDAGRTWDSAADIAGQFVVSLAVSPAIGGDGTVFAGTAGRGVYVSHDRGGTWQQANGGLTAARVGAVHVDSRGVVEGGIGGLSRLTPGGIVWQDLPVGSDLIVSYAAAGADAYAGTVGQGVRVSRDGGASWQASYLLRGTAAAVEVSPAYSSDGTVLAADGQVYRSTDHGVTWQQALGIAGNDVSRIRFSPTFSSDHTVFAATLLHGVMRSADGGSNWTSASAGLPLGQINDVLASPAFATDRTAYAATGGSGIYVSRDAGDTWTRLATQPGSLLVTALAWGTGGDLLAGTNRGIFDCNGGDWSQLGGGWDDYVTDLAPDTGSSTLYIGTLGDGIWSLGLPAGAKPTPVETPTARPTPTRSPRPLHLRLRVYPVPLESGRPAVIVAAGTPHTQLRLALSARRWHRTFRGTLDAGGRAGFGFRAPGSTMSAAGILTAGSEATSATVRVRVRGSP